MFKDKNNPLLDAAKSAMQKGDEHRKAVSAVNEHFGVYSRRALPLAKKAEYDIALKKVLAGENLVLEETQEQLQEVSKKTLGSYIEKASNNSRDKSFEAGSKASSGNLKGSVKDIDKSLKRQKGIEKAVRKIVKEKIEALDERVLANKKDDYSPSYEKADAKGARMKRIMNKVKDMKKQLDEVSKETLKSYISKSKESMKDSVHKSDLALKRKLRAKTDEKREAAQKDRDKADKTFSKRLVGRQLAATKLKEDVDVKSIQEEIANNLYKRYEAVNEADKQAWVDALNEEEFGILHEFYNPNVKFRQANANPLASIRNGLKNILAPEPVQPTIKSAPEETRDIAAAGMAGVRAAASAVTRGTIGLNTNSNINANSPARGIAAAAPRPSTTSTVAAAAKEKEVTIGNGHDEYGNTISGEKIAAALKSAAADNSPANAEQIGKDLAGAAKPSAPETASTDAPAQTAAAAAETRDFRPTSASRREPMTPKRSFGFGDQGSGSDSAGSITNRAFGAVNEEVQNRSSLDVWLNKYEPKKKK